MENFIESLNDLILETGKSLRQLADESGVSAMQYSRYLRGSIPTISITMKIAKYFNCSLDFMFNLCEKRNYPEYKTYDYDISKFVFNYEKLLQENKTTHYKFIKTGGFDESLIRHWKKGSVPIMDIVYFIAKSLNGSMDNLVGRY